VFWATFLALLLEWEERNETFEKLLRAAVYTSAVKEAIAMLAKEPEKSTVEKLLRAAVYTSGVKEAIAMLAKEPEKSTGFWETWMEK
jgi:hypothetical protein